MRKEELIKLAKELSEQEDLKGREDDLFFLKREFNRLSNIEEETFHDKLLTEEFNKYYFLLASRVSELSRSSLEDKKEIIKKAKALLEDEKGIRNLNKEFSTLFIDLKHLPKCSKEEDDAIFSEFKSLKEQASAKVDTYYSNLKQSFIDKKAKKENIIKEAKENLKISNVREATNKMNALMEEWKATGFAGKDVDESLWNEFKAVRAEFNEARKTRLIELEKEFEEKAIKKEEIIKKIKYITSEAYFTPEEIKQIKDLEREFKGIGFSGKEKDQVLWEGLQAAIKKYYEEMKFYK